MKINEFLIESENEKLDELLGLGLGLAARGAGALLRGSSTGRQAVQAVGRRVAPTMRGSVSQADSILQRAGMDPNSWLNSKWRNVLAWQIQRKGMKSFRAGQAAAYENSKIAANYISDLGLKGFGLATLVYDLTSYYQTRKALEQKYANDPDKLNQELNSLNVSTVASVFLPRVVGTVGRLGTKAVGAIVGKIGTPLAGAKVKQWGGMAAKMGEAAAMGYFRSDKGKQWLANALAHVTLGIGSAEGILGAFGEIISAGVNMAAGIANAALGGGGGDPNLISIGLAGKWLPGMLNNKKDQADSDQEN